jgi:prepilin-type N-terminal cleavage/methylation domain-containing protein
MWPWDEDKQLTRAGRRGARRGGPRAARAFSLAELMIALAILGMGLLVIAAALPAGARYQKQSADMATGAAAAESALDLIEQNVCRRQRALDASDNLVAPVLFQPRKATGTGYPTHAVGQAVAAHEPWIKVRPLFTQTINMTPGAGNYGGDVFDPNSGQERNWIEEAIATYVRQWGGNVAELQGLEYDPPSGAVTKTPWMRPALPALALFYPPVTADLLPYDTLSQHGHIRTPREFLPIVTGNAALQYAAAERTASETAKALERTIVWTAFYRRVSYQTGSDPSMYEVIVVASRRPTMQHRYPVQNPASATLSGSSFTTQRAGTRSSYFNVDTATPMPWLVSFQSWTPTLVLNTDYEDIGGARVLKDTFKRKPLTFVASSEVGPLLPPGSIFIPAANDLAPPFCGGDQFSGFVPSAPDALPIFEVAERTENTNGTFNITVKDNGYYPWLNSKPTDYWPVWVIPPAIEALAGGQPAFPEQSPVLAVARRYICIREFP